MARVAIIGGTGLEELPGEPGCEEIPGGPADGGARLFRYNGVEAVYLPRHGSDHSLAPHQIDYRANIAALDELGVTRILATNAVGSLRLDLEPGALVLLDDFIDFSSGRGASYWDGIAGSPVVHTDFSDPYCVELRRALEESAADVDVDLLPRGTYLCANGPRYETPAEVRLFAQWGADMVGMTGLPEAVFAREAGICYAAVAIITNYACGLTDSQVSHAEVVERMAGSAASVRSLLLNALSRIPRNRSCGCAR